MVRARCLTDVLSKAQLFYTQFLLMLSLQFQYFDYSNNLLHKTKQFHDFDHYPPTQTVLTKPFKCYLKSCYHPREVRV